MKLRRQLRDEVWWFVAVLSLFVSIVVFAFLSGDLP
jgi:hypothetical protein